ncbi:hypothetical protein BFP70_01495 [Thioclava sp. SK-1]|nr:hypothetical protein BFP70_01495 [Thioclava sp. SK-1]
MKDLASGDAPLCDAQEGLWMAQRLAPDNALFNTGQYIELTGPLDLQAFVAAHDEAMAQACALRLVITPQGRQTLAGPVPLLDIVDLRDHVDGHAAALAAMHADSHTPVDPSKDALSRFILFRLSDGLHYWYERIHHLAIDGYGMVLITNRVAQLYASHIGTAPAGPDLAPFSQAITAQDSYRNGPKPAVDAAFWAQELTALDQEVASPCARSAVPICAGQFHRVQTTVAPDIVARLQQRAQELRLGWPDVLTILSAAYLRRVSPIGAPVYGLPFMARFGTKAARVPCMWMNVLPYPLQLDEDDVLNDQLRAQAARLTQMRRHGHYRSEAARRDIGRTRREERIYGPLINVQPFDVAPEFAGLDSHLHILSAGPVEDITLSYRGDGRHGLTLEIDANPNRYDMDELHAHLTRLTTFLDTAVDAQRLRDVATVTAAEHRQQVFDLNATDHPVARTTLTALIHQQMQRSPDAPAVMFHNDTLTYHELDRRSAALAEHLLDQGAGPGTLVAVALHRGIDLAVSLMAVLRVGAAYVPLDPDQPDQRLQELMQQVQPVALLAHSPIGPHKAVQPADWPHIPRGATLPAPAPDDLAYVLFTSGSTGAPKGVMIEHDAIVNRLLWMRDHYKISPDDRILQKTPITFDVSVWELFLPYLAGATLVMAPPDAHRDPKALAQVIREHRVSVLHFVPSMLAAFLADPVSQGLRTRLVFCSGEALPADLRDRFHGRVAAELHNLYGPTEAAVDVTYWDAGRHDTSNPLPIGSPVWNTRCYILDSALRPVPCGTPGELFLGGRQLARGYLGRDDLTAARFLPDPFRPNARIYATGDLARRRTDGAITYLGRNDHQVKIRGMRVELGEIEAAILAHDGISEAVVLARQDMGSGTRLVAYIVTQGTGLWGDDADSAETDARRAALRHHLGQALPQHMIPSDIMPLTQLPVTANGKLDRRALPRPTTTPAQTTQPQPGLEADLARAMQDALCLPHLPGREADFFALGGDSLSALRLLLEVETATGLMLPLGQLFETPVIHALATAMTRQETASAGLSPVLHLHQGPASATPLILLHPAGGLCWGYRTLARAVCAQGDRPVIGLQSPVLNGAAMPDKLQDLTRAYADLIDATTDSQTIDLAGWSLGGILAQDLAVELRLRGRRPNRVALLDAYPAECWRAEPEPDPATALRALLAIAGLDPDAHPQLDTRDKVVAFLNGRNSLMGALPLPVLDAVVCLVTGTNRLIRGHDHRHYDGAMIHIRAAHDHAGRGLTSALWQPHCAELTALDLPCLHKDMVAPDHCDAIASALTGRS